MKFKIFKCLLCFRKNTISHNEIENNIEFISDKTNGYFIYLRELNKIYKRLSHIKQSEKEQLLNEIISTGTLDTIADLITFNYDTFSEEELRSFRVLRGKINIILTNK